MTKADVVIVHVADSAGGHVVSAALNGHAHPRRLFRMDAGPLSVAATDRRVFWVTEPATGPSDIDVQRIGASTHRVLLHRVYPNASLLIAGKFLYWTESRDVARVRLDGSRAQRHFLRLPSGGEGSAADGMATDGRYLYFDQCSRARIGRVPIARPARPADAQWIASNIDCSDDLAYGNGYLYYVSGSDAIDRIRRDGTGSPRSWQTQTHSALGPGDLVASSKWVYWDTCSGPECAQSHLARESTSGGRVQAGILSNADQGLTLAPKTRRGSHR